MSDLQLGMDRFNFFEKRSFRFKTTKKKRKTKRWFFDTGRRFVKESRSLFLTIVTIVKGSAREK